MLALGSVHRDDTRTLVGESDAHERDRRRIASAREAQRVLVEHRRQREISNP